MSGWATLGELPAGTVFESEGGDIGMVLSTFLGPGPTSRTAVSWKRLNDPGLNVTTSRADVKARPLRLVRVGSSDLERAFVSALVDDPQDGASLNAFADWLRDQNREKDAENLQADWRQKVLDAVDEVVHAEANLAGEYERHGGDYPRPTLLDQARAATAWAELRRRLGVSDDRG